MSSFETIDKSTIRNSRGIAYIDFRNSLSPKYYRVWLDIMLGYLALVLILSAAAYMQKTYPKWFLLTIPVGAILVGYTVSALHLFIHEASHYNIAPNRRLNDLMSNIFLGLLVGMDVQYYRTVHFAHHRLLGTTQDTEKSYFEPISIYTILEMLSGVRIIKVIIHRNKNIRSNERSSESIIKKNNRIFFAAAVLNLLLILVLLYIGYWQVACIWLIGLGSAFPFFASFRQVLEHRSISASANINYYETDHGIVHRMFGDGPIASTLGAAGFNRHLLHHWDPQVSYTRLKEVETFLKDTPLGHMQAEAQTTYWKTFISLIR
jgi:fatty acid desaturase